VLHVSWSTELPGRQTDRPCFPSGAIKGRDTIYRLTSNGGTATPIKIGCTALCLGDDYPAYDRSGTKVVFERAYGPVRNNNAAVAAIMTTDADGSGVTQLTHRTRPTSSEDHNATWSPDGRRIAFERINTTAKPVHASAIFVMTASGRDVRRLTSYSLDASDPKWSRDGTRILFNSYDEPAAGQDANVYTIRSDGSGLTQLTKYTGGTLQAYVDDWSPDGRMILFHLIGKRDGTSINALFVMRVDGTGVRQLTHMPAGANPRNASWGTAR